MLHNEHLRKADELYEVYHDNNSNALHVYIKDGNAIMYQSLDDLVRHIYFGEQTDRVYCSETDLEAIYESDMYTLEDIANKFNLTATF